MNDTELVDLIILMIFYYFIVDLKVLDKIKDINKECEAPIEGDNVEKMDVDDGDVAPGGSAVKRRNMLHPFKILLGLMTYKSGGSAVYVIIT